AALLTTGMAFKNATFQAQGPLFDAAASGLPATAKTAVGGLADEVYEDQFAFLAALETSVKATGDTEAIAAVEGAAQDLAKGGLRINGMLVLLAIMGYIAGFAISLGPVMWAMFSEIFPARMRGIAISAAGFFNSAISFLVQKMFPVGLATLGPDKVFFFFGGFAVLALAFSAFVVPETKGKSLEELEAELIGPS
ncbi:MAG: SP family arabinose:H+ symporter-like MFS transporter, partial [Planctomycetota bacterium]